jgi:hypothetical protein
MMRRRYPTTSLHLTETMRYQLRELVRALGIRQSQVMTLALHKLFVAEFGKRAARQVPSAPAGADQEPAYTATQDTPRRNVATPRPGIQ